MATSWFTYNSGSITSPTSYSIVGQQPSCETPKQVICAIFAEIQFISGTQRPIITSALQSEITNAFNSKLESANVLLRPQ